MNNEEREQAKDFNSLFQELKTDLTCYLNNRLGYFKLSFLERLGQTSSLLALGLIVTFLAFSVFGFALIALGFYLGELLNSYAAGFGVVALCWLGLLLIILLLRNPLKEFFLNRTIRILYKIEKEAEDEQR